LLKAQENKRTQNRYNKLKYNESLFFALLQQQKQTATNPEGLGITIGNPNAGHTVVKVCNPFCGPCAKAHTEIDKLIENNPNVKVQILFTATGDEKDIKTPPAKHLLAIDAKGDKALTAKALDDWYLAEQKDYDSFAAKYPMREELLTQQSSQLKQMSEWCDENKVTATPTFFVNLPSPKGEGQGVRLYPLPEIYSVTDLKYFLTT
jgi:protein-disulfide isomerase